MKRRSRRWFGWAVGMVLGAIGCAALGAVAVADTDALTQPITLEIEGAERALSPIPLPDLSRTEEEVRETLRTERSRLAAALEDPPASVRDLAQAYGEMGGFYLAYKLYVAAEACYRNAQGLAAEDFRWPYYLGYRYQQDSQLEHAAASYRRALDLQPDYAPAQLRLGQVYLDLNQPNQAEPLLRKAMASEGLRAAALEQLGKVALARRELESAVLLFEKVLSEQPQASRIHYPLAMAYRSLGDIEQAKRHLAARGTGEPAIVDPLLDELSALLSGLRSLYYHAIEALRDGYYEVTVETFGKALALEPTNVNARVTMARALYLSGNPAGAREQLAEALRREPNHALGNFLFGVLLEEEGSQKAAVGHYRATLAVDPEHGGAHHYLGSVLMREGRYGEAARHLAKAVEQVPQNYAARLLALMAALRSGASHRDIKHRLETVRVEYPDQSAMFAFPLVRLLAASPEAGVRDGARALELAQALYDRSQRLEDAETLAMAYAELGQFEQAISAQEQTMALAMAFGRFDRLTTLGQNLQRYRNGEPCRVPWSEDDPIFQPPPPVASGPFLEYPTRSAF